MMENNARPISVTGPSTGPTPAENMICGAAREIRDNEIVFVGIGLPILTTLLAQRLHAPNSILVYESGIVGAKPTRVAMSIADPGLVTGSSMLINFFDLFAMFLQGGHIDLGFVGGAQIDKFGNVNSTAIGNYQKPISRFPGGGGAYDMTMASRTMVIMPHEKRRFVETVDFVTTPGHRIRGKSRKQLGIPGGGPQLVITTRGIFRFNEDGEMILDSYFEDSSVEDILNNTGWNLKVSPTVRMAKGATAKEIETLRKLDPKGFLLKKS
jgi:glutaconate CoA-transferase subunit B